MNIERLRYFSVLAAYLNYTKASEQLYISQPSLSKQIAQLERELGVKLFARSKHMVALTPEGRECLDIIHPLLDSYQALTDWAEQKRQSRPVYSIRIGYYGMLLKDIVLTVVNGLMDRYPQMDVSLKNYSPSRLTAALESGAIDLAILRDTYCSSLKGVCVQRLCTVRQCLLVPTSHPLAGRSLVHLSELSEEPFVDLFQKDSPQGHDATLSLCRKYGLEPKISHVCDDPNSYIMMIQGGRGLGISHTHRSTSITGVTAVPLDCRDEDLNSGVMAVWRNEKGRDGAPLPCNILPAAPSLSRLLGEIASLYDTAAQK